MREAHQTELERDRNALAVERARSKELRAELEAAGKREAMASAMAWSAREELRACQQSGASPSASPS